MSVETKAVAPPRFFSCFFLVFASFFSFRLINYPSGFSLSLPLFLNLLSRSLALFFDFFCSHDFLFSILFFFHKDRITEQTRALEKSERDLRFAMPKNVAAGLEAVDRLVKEQVR